MECSHWPTPTKWVCNPFASVSVSVSASMNNSAYYNLTHFLSVSVSVSVSGSVNTPLNTLPETDSATDSGLVLKPDGYIVLCITCSHFTDSDSDPYSLFLCRTGI